MQRGWWVGRDGAAMGGVVSRCRDVEIGVVVWRCGSGVKWW